MTVLFKGPFTERDLRELANALRMIERRNPTEDFHMIVDAEAMGNDDAQRLLRQVFPAIEGVPVKTTVYEKK
jgi:hypothetical protein